MNLFSKKDVLGREEEFGRWQKTNGVKVRRVADKKGSQGSFAQKRGKRGKREFGEWI